MACSTQGVVKRFFNEKEVTSTLVMDALVSGVKQIEESSRLAESKKVLLAPPLATSTAHVDVLGLGQHMSREAHLLFHSLSDGESADAAISTRHGSLQRGA